MDSKAGQKVLVDCFDEYGDDDDDNVSEDCCRSCFLMGLVVCDDFG